MSNQVMNRRSFVSGTLAMGSAATIGFAGSGVVHAAESAQPSGVEPMTADAYHGLTWSFEVPPERIADDEISRTITDDVIVVGSGVAGLMCAASVVGHGGKCTLFSAGSKAVSRGGSNHAVGSKTQARLGIDYTPETAAAYFNNEISRQGYRVDSRRRYAPHLASRN